MSYIVTKKAVENSTQLKAQHSYIANARKVNYNREKEFAKVSGLATNDALIPADVWRYFDKQTSELLLGDEGSTILKDLQPLAMNVNIGKLVVEYRRVNDTDFEVRSSVDGQHGKPVNQSAYDYDGSLVLVHSTQVGRKWRELEGLLSEGFNSLLDDQAQAIRYVNKRIVDDTLNGTPNVAYKGFKSYGLKSHRNTLALDLGQNGVGVDLTNPAITYPQAYNAILAVVSSLHGRGNNAEGDITIYLSPEAYMNLLRIANPNTSNTENMLTALSRVPGVAAYKKTEALNGNELLAIILSSRYIRPIVGMPVTTTPIMRVTPMDDWHVMVWAATGIQVRADGNGRSGVLYASGV